MKKNIGSQIGLYPTPLVVVGTMVDGKPNWLLVGHLGIIGHDRIMMSLAKPHYTNKGIKETKVLSVNIVDEAMLAKADYVGIVSGNKVDKSDVFDYSVGENGAPIINDAPLTMECSVEDIYETAGFESFVLSINNTYVEEVYLNDRNQIDYHTLKPILFEMPTYEYFKTGDFMAKCTELGKKFK